MPPFFFFSLIFLLLIFCRYWYACRFLLAAADYFFDVSHYATTMLMPRRAARPPCRRCRAMPLSLFSATDYYASMFFRLFSSQRAALIRHFRRLLPTALIFRHAATRHYCYFAAISSPCHAAMMMAAFLSPILIVIAPATAAGSCCRFLRCRFSSIFSSFASAATLFR